MSAMPCSFLLLQVNWGWEVSCCPVPSSSEREGLKWQSLGVQELADGFLVSAGDTCRDTYANTHWKENSLSKLEA